jgi:hypothetical protein
MPTGVSFIIVVVIFTSSSHFLPLHLYILQKQHADFEKMVSAPDIKGHTPIVLAALEYDSEFCEALIAQTRRPLWVFDTISSFSYPLVSEILVLIPVSSFSNPPW